MSVFRIVHDTARLMAARAVQQAPDGYVVTVKEPRRSNDQNAKFHAICSDLAKSNLQWAGKRRKKDEWKELLISAHSKATNQGFEIVPGIEGEFVNIRESTASMSKARGSSLIEYATAFCAMNGVKLNAVE